MLWDGGDGFSPRSGFVQLIIDEQEQLKTIEDLEIENRELIEVPEMLLEMDQEAIDQRTIAESPQKSLL